MHVDFKTLLKVLPIVIKARHPVLIRGAHGKGKSEFVDSLAPSIGTWLYPNEKDRVKAFGKANYIYPIIDRRASQMPDAGDMMGLPFMEGEVTSFKSMKWFHRACVEPCILKFDEIDRGPVEVRQAIFQVNDSRKLGDASLHPDTIVFGCINGGIGDVGTYQVGDMDPAELDRWTVYDLKPTVKDWLEYAKNKLHVQVYDFINQNNTWLEHEKEFEPNKVYPSRRSWMRFNSAIDDNLVDDCTTDKESLMILFHLADGYLGNECAIALQDFCKNYSKQITLDDIIVKGKLELAKSLEINQHMAIIEKFEQSDIFKNPMYDVSGKDNDGNDILVNHKTMTNLAEYLFIVPHELAMKIWEQTTKLYAFNGIALHGTVLGPGKSVSYYIGKLNGATDD